MSWLDRWLDRRLHTREVGQSRGKGPAIGPPPPFEDPTCDGCTNLAAENARLRQERDALQWLADPVHMAAYLLAREAVEEG
jgi:hypothetical protein